MHKQQWNGYPGTLLLTFFDNTQYSAIYEVFISISICWFIPFTITFHMMICLYISSSLEKQLGIYV